MTTDEKIQILAKAILELSEKAATTWDYDGEQTTATGVAIDRKIVDALEAIIQEPNRKK